MRLLDGAWVVHPEDEAGFHLGATVVDDGRVLEIQRDDGEAQIGLRPAPRAGVDARPGEDRRARAVHLTMLSHVTFTGWDGHTDLEALKDFLRAYPPRSIEVAVLLSENRMGNDRYPETGQAHLILDVAARSHQRTALHVCGSQARAMIKLGGRTALTAGLISRVDRVQINVATMEWLTPSHTIARTIDRTVIVQTRDPLGWPAAQPGVEYLFDRSGGRGESLMTPRDGLSCPYPTPVPGRTVGYAGGLGPDNVAEFMGRIYARNGRNERYWIDMETGIRERLDSYPGGPKVAADVPPPTQVSIAKCRAVMEAVAPWLRP